MNKYDKRRKYYLILDCETATLPKASQYTDEQRKTIAIAKPLIYDLAWTVVDRNGKIYAKKNYIISEIFFDLQVFATAYYKDKRNIYLDKIAKGECIVTSWETAKQELIEDLDACVASGAYNAMFDFKKAIPFTELYISKYYKPNFHKWLKEQNRICEWLIEGNSPTKQTSDDNDIFRYNAKEYALFDIWGLACEHLLNNDDYKQTCIDNGWQSATGKYFPTNAEKAYAYISGKTEFEESHTALDDTIIETEIFALVVKVTKNKWDMGITYFPFRVLGMVKDFNS